MEIDASYIKGMLNNLDIQLGTAMNRWIVGIKLFHFELVHVPGTLPTGLDGLSCHDPSPNDPIVDDDTDDWLDRTMGFSVILMNSTTPWTSQLGFPHLIPIPITSGSIRDIQLSNYIVHLAQ